MSRSFLAPREQLFKAWTDPELMAQWWGPKGAKIIFSKMDLRVGGAYHYGMGMQDGKTVWGKSVYQEITPPSRLVFINSFSDEKGGTTRHPLSPNWSLEMMSTITFEDEQGGTLLTVQWAPHNATPIEAKTFAENHESMKQGWSGTFDQLEDFVRKKAA
ncbi:MAG: SRPBCC domain-containing protein [Dongiaceae bacterium]